MVTRTKQVKSYLFWRTLRRQRTLFLLLLPAVIGVFFFGYLPMYGISSAFLDFNIVRGFRGSEFVGLKNFMLLFSRPEFPRIFGYSLYLAMVRLVVIFPLPIVFALLLNDLDAKRFKSFVQSVSYLPHFISWVVVAGIVYQVLGSDGIMNTIAKVAFGRGTIEILMDEGSFPVLYGLSSAWKEMGYSAIVYLAAMSGIDPQLYEAAYVDGAGRMKTLLHVTIPGLLPTMSMLFILSVGGLLAVGFDPVWNLQNSVTRSATHTMDTFIYVEGIRNARYSFASAFGLFNSVLAIILVTGSNALAKKMTNTGLY